MATAVPIKRKRYDDPHEDYRRKLVGAIDALLNHFGEICPEYATGQHKPSTAAEKPAAEPIPEPIPIVAPPDIASRIPNDWLGPCVAVVETMMTGFNFQDVNECIAPILQSLASCEYACFDTFHAAFDSAFNSVPRRRESTEARRWFHNAIREVKRTWSYRDKEELHASVTAQDDAEIDALLAMIDIQQRSITGEERDGTDANAGGAQRQRRNPPATGFAARPLDDAQLDEIDRRMRELGSDELQRVLRFFQARKKDAIEKRSGGELVLNTHRLDPKSQRDLSDMLGISRTRRGGRGPRARGGGRGRG